MQMRDAITVTAAREASQGAATAGGDNNAFVASTASRSSAAADRVAAAGRKYLPTERTDRHNNAFAALSHSTTETLARSCVACKQQSEIANCRLCVY